MSLQEKSTCSKCPECGEMAFAVSSAREIYYCFGCKIGGNTRDLARRFQDAALWAKQPASVAVRGKVIPFTPKQ